MRFHASLPMYFLGDVVLIATYLMNRLPSTILHIKTPYELLLGHPPSYKHLKWFSCLAFAYNPFRTTDKLWPREALCLFLVYPQTQKGYNLLNLLTKQTFVSIDVTFVEYFSIQK